jgi:transcriptional regulator
VFVPEDYLPPDPGWPGELIRANPLAILVTTGPDGTPAATHVPTIPDRESGDPGRTGGAIFGHLNRRNPHWAAVQGGRPALLIFQGTHGYVSPTVYQTVPAAPTWDFTAVHVRGRLTPIDGRTRTLEVIKATVAGYERDLGTGWDMSDSLGYFDRLLPGVGAFRVEVERVDSMFKLSQEQPAEVRARTIDAFAADTRGEYRQLAELIRRAWPGPASARESAPAHRDASEPRHGPGDPPPVATHDVDRRSRTEGHRS